MPLILSSLQRVTSLVVHSFARKERVITELFHRLASIVWPDVRKSWPKEKCQTAIVTYRFGKTLRDNKTGKLGTARQKRRGSVHPMLTNGHHVHWRGVNDKTQKERSDTALGKKAIQQIMLHACHI